MGNAAVASTSKARYAPPAKYFSATTSVKIQYFHKAVFHPFVKVNPPLLAVAQVAVTDEYINRSIRNSMIELAIVASDLLYSSLFGGLFAVTISS
jgi:hypothetical protein